MGSLSLYHLLSNNVRKNGILCASIFLVSELKFTRSFSINFFLLVYVSLNGWITLPCLGVQIIGIVEGFDFKIKNQDTYVSVNSPISRLSNHKLILHLRSIVAYFRKLSFIM